MINQMTIDGVSAIISYDSDLELFRGEFIGLTGGADFHATDVPGLKREGEISLRVYLDACRESGIEPFKSFSGKFNVRIPAELHATIVAAAAAQGKSLNQWISDVLDKEVHAA